MILKVAWGLFFINGFLVINGAPATNPSNDGANNVETVFGTLGENLDLHGLLGLFKNYKTISTFITSLIDISPLMRDLMTQMTKEDPELKVLMKMATGELPSLDDLYKLSKSGHHDLYKAWIAFTNKDPRIKTLNESIHETDPDYKSILKAVLQGGPDSDHVKHVSDKYSVTGVDVTNYKSLQGLTRFVVDNWQNVMRVFTALTKNPIDYVTVLRALVSMDYSNFPKTYNGLLKSSGSKYTVNEIKTDKPDEELTNFLKNALVQYPKDLSGSVVNGAAEKDVDTYVNSLIDILNHMMSPPKSSNKK